MQIPQVERSCSCLSCNISISFQHHYTKPLQPIEDRTKSQLKRIRLSIGFQLTQVHHLIKFERLLQVKRDASNDFLIWKQASQKHPSGAFLLQ